MDRMNNTLERNKQTVLAFYEVGLNQKNFQAATALRQDFPALRAEVKRIFADGEYVVAHVYGVRVPGQPGTAIVDIFRLDADGKIVEHWDVMQPIPDQSANQNGMF